MDLQSRSEIAEFFLPKNATFTLNVLDDGHVEEASSQFSGYFLLNLLLLWIILQFLLKQ